MAGWYRSAAKTTCKSRPGSGVSFVCERACRQGPAWALSSIPRCAKRPRAAKARIVSPRGVVSPPSRQWRPISEVPFNTKNRVAGLERPTPHERVRALPRLARRYLVRDFESQMDPCPRCTVLTPAVCSFDPRKSAFANHLRRRPAAHWCAGVLEARSPHGESFPT